jgi:hypothetical protein
MARGMKLKKAKARLDAQIAAYEKTCKEDQKGGRGYHRPGSLNGRK